MPATSPKQLKSLLAEYKVVNEETLWANLEYFLKAIIPVADEVGIKMAMHPDDPPRPIFGLPRIVKNRDDLARLVKIVDSPANGLTLCSGSLGADLCNNIDVAGARVRRPWAASTLATCATSRSKPDGTFYESTPPFL